MRRRSFVQTLAAGAATAIVPWPRRRAAFRAWTWVHGSDQVSGDEWRRRFARIRAAGIEAVLVSGGRIETISAAARAEGLAFHRWMWTLNRNGDAWVKANHPVWFSVSRTGDSILDKPPYVGYYQWLCPTRPEVREYLGDQVHTLASTDGVAGVPLDYVRHPDVILPVGLWEKYGLVQDREHPQFDFCYCRVCRDSFQRMTGKDPLQLPDPTADQAWREFRWNAVTDTVRVLAEAARGAGKPISAAVLASRESGRGGGMGDGTGLESRVLELEVRGEELRRRLEAVEGLRAAAEPATAAAGDRRGAPVAAPTAAGAVPPSIVPAASGGWSGSSLLARVSTVCFPLVVALGLRTVADSGAISPAAGAFAGLGYAALLMLAGGVLYARRSELAPVFAICVAVLLCSIVVETYAHFGSLPGPAAYLALGATALVMTVLGERNRTPVPGP